MSLMVSARKMVISVMGSSWFFRPGVFLEAFERESERNLERLVPEMVGVLFADEELKKMVGLKKGDDFVQVTCDCTSPRYGDAVGRLRAFVSGKLPVNAFQVVGKVQTLWQFTHWTQAALTKPSVSVSTAAAGSFQYMEELSSTRWHATLVSWIPWPSCGV